MRVFVLLIFTAMLSACATTAAPNFFNGNYYMAGDDSCRKFRQISDRAIMCMDSQGRETGYREAMTPQQMQMYQAHQLNQQMQMQRLTQQLNQMGQSYQRSAETMYQQSQQYYPPAVQPITPPGGNQIRCINAGIYTNCRY